MSNSWNERGAYETPTVTFYGNLTSLTQSVPISTGSDGLCTGFGIPVAGLPSHTVCKHTP